MALFALSFPLADVLLGSWGVLALIGLRNAFGMAVIFLAWRLVERRVPMAGLPWLRGVLIGGAGFGVGSTMLLMAQSMTDPVTISLVIAVMPLAAVGLEVLFDGRRLTRWFVIGLALVLVGGALATGESMADAQVGPGLALGMLSTLVYSWGSRATVKGLPGLSPLTQTMLTTNGMAVFCMIAFGVGHLAGWEAAHLQKLDTTGSGVFVLYAVLGLALSQVLWVTAVGRIGVGIASFHVNAVPFYVMVILVAFGGSWNPQQVAGAVIVVTGVILSQKRRRIRG
jgi:drug/metabolite transporter (DMT)-like permease